MVYAAHVFEGIGMGFMILARQPNVQRHFCAFFGASPVVSCKYGKDCLPITQLIDLLDQSADFGLSCSLKCTPVSQYYTLLLIVLTRKHSDSGRIFLLS